MTHRRSRSFLGFGLLLFSAFVLWFFVFLKQPGDGGAGLPTAPATATSRAGAPKPAETIEEIEPPAEPEVPRAWPEAGQRILVGTISDPAGVPIGGARVRVELEGRAVASGRTDLQGNYRLTDVPPRPTLIAAEATGFSATTQARPRFPLGREVRVDLVLVPIPGVRGWVRAGEAPVEGASVTLSLKGGTGVFARAISDEGGRFFLPWPDQGRALIQAYHGQHGRAHAIAVEPTEIVLQLPAGGFIEGRVVDQGGQGVERFSITASPLLGNAGPPAQSFDSDDGNFRLGPLASGEVQVWAAAEGYQPAERQGLKVRDGETIEGVVLTLKGSVVLVGRVTDAATGGPVEGAQVIPAEWRSGALAEAVGTETDADGRYRLDALPGTRTSIRVKAEGYRSVLIGGVEGQPGQRIERDFVLNPQRADQRPATELTGVGAVLRGHADGVAIGQILAGGPAEGALEAGDVVVAVDGEPVRGRDMSTVAQAIRGEEGSDVELMVRRGGEGEPQRIVLRRSRVTVPDPHPERN